MSKNILSGARTIFKLNGEKVAVATGCSVNSGIQYDDIRTLDLLESFEFVEVRYNCSLSCEIVKVVNQSPTVLGFFPHIDLISILTQPELVAEFYDAVTGSLIGVGEGCKPQDNNFDVRAGQSVANNLTFVLKRFKDASEV